MNDEKYDYEEAVRTDIMNYLAEHCDSHLDEHHRDRLYDRMWISDDVTGNGSGSYTFSSWKAESYLCHNVDLIEEVIAEYGEIPNIHRGAEFWDVSIRCMMLGRVLDACIAAWNETHPEEDEDAE